MTSGRRFYKMSGSGNDFVVFDARDGETAAFEEPERIRRLCERRHGVGADGVVIIAPSDRAHVRMAYFNRDGSRGAMCGNAALCVTRLAGLLGYAIGDDVRIETDDAVLSSRFVDGVPEVELSPVRSIRARADAPLEGGERAVGYAVVGVPHVVVLCADVATADVQGRGAALRSASWTGEEGANVNFVSRSDRGWSIRTYERGVEAETLACGTGTAASAALLQAWGLSGPETQLLTRSGCVLGVTLSARDGQSQPRLRGEGRLVFEGQLREA
jgi:diaminopimelate epimerase